MDRIDAGPDVASALTLLGVTPGSRLRVVQRFPSFVVEVEGTEIALEREVAAAVWLGPTPG